MNRWEMVGVPISPHQLPPLLCLRPAAKAAGVSKRLAFDLSAPSVLCDTIRDIRSMVETKRLKGPVFGGLHDDQRAAFASDQYMHLAGMTVLHANGLGQLKELSRSCKETIHESCIGRQTHFCGQRISAYACLREVVEKTARNWARD